MTLPLLRITDLKLSIPTYQGRARILDHIELSVMKGEILGIVGESGCGKSTLVRSLLGILPRSLLVEAGEILFDGEDLLKFSEEELVKSVRGKRIGFIPQDPYLSLNPVFTVGKQLLEIMRWHAHGGRKDHLKHLLALLRRVQLPDPESALDRYPHQFSGGQRQRLLIAAALSCAPSLIVADEPTTALDVTTQGQILLLLRELVSEFDLSILLVTHDLGVVAQVCDRICVMYAGQTVEIGETACVLAQPSHPYTRALVACHPERSTSFVGIPGVVPSPIRAPSGCRFSPRCNEAREACLTRPSKLLHVTPDRLVNCINFELACS
jgi:oligopeptide/dipeptide ABC transporter ATP-binding protein